MRIQILSDLHLDRPRCDFSVKPVAADVVVLAGDIHRQDAGIAWARAAFATPHVICLAGNHEFYGTHWDTLIARSRRAAAQAGIAFLEDEAIVIGGVRFLGATLWTDFALFGAQREQFCMREAEAMMYDFRRIGWMHPPDARDAAQPVVAGATAGSEWPYPLTAADTQVRHRASRRWLESMLATPFEGATVVVTHHLPSMRSVAARYRADPVSAAFASDLDDLIERYAPALWVHGHTHDSFDYRIGPTRVVCNPRGYMLRSGVLENSHFRDDLVVEV